MKPDETKAAGHDEAEPSTVPETIEGWCVLHQMFAVDWPSWKGLDDAERKHAVEEAVAALGASESDNQGPSALFSVLGHKADLMLLHFRKTFDELNAAELAVAQLKLADYLEPTTSYVSVIELGLYEATARAQGRLRQQGLEPGSQGWREGLDKLVEEEREALTARLFPRIPARRYLCFYPMDKARGEIKNWYQVSMAERQRMMRAHGAIGRRYAGRVIQVISGSIGFDDWEWGVDLFAEDPLVFKKLIYEMRFDEVSAVYAQFGEFYLGLRFKAAELGALMSGAAPSMGLESA